MAVFQLQCYVARDRMWHIGLEVFSVALVQIVAFWTVEPCSTVITKVLEER
jgi:hypothetical protein